MLRSKYSTTTEVLRGTSRRITKVLKVVYRVCSVRLYCFARRARAAHIRSPRPCPRPTPTLPSAPQRLSESTPRTQDRGARGCGRICSNRVGMNTLSPRSLPLVFSDPDEGVDGCDIHTNWLGFVLFLPVVFHCYYVVCACPPRYRWFVCARVYLISN